MLLISLSTPAMASEPKEKMIDLGDGFYVVETITYGPSTRSGDIVNGSKNATLYQGSTVIGKTTLYAEFDISGSSARATDSEITGTGSGGWEYASGTTNRSGNKATGIATYQMNSSTKSHIITITCSPNGTLS